MGSFETRAEINRSHAAADHVASDFRLQRRDSSDVEESVMHKLASARRNHDECFKKSFESQNFEQGECYRLSFAYEKLLRQHAQ